MTTYRANMNKIAINDELLNIFKFIGTIQENKDCSVTVTVQLTELANKLKHLRNTIFEDIIGNTDKSVNHPDYYQHPSGIECIDVARYYSFNIGNAFKYLWRAGLKKDPTLSDKEKEIQDLQKAVWYINDRIKELKI